MHPTGTATAHQDARTTHAFFTPSDLPGVTTTPDTPHAHRAATWALRALGRPETGGTLVLISDPGTTPHAESLATALAISDARHGALTTLLTDPTHLSRLMTAAGLPTP